MSRVSELSAVTSSSSQNSSSTTSTSKVKESSTKIADEMKSWEKQKLSAIKRRMQIATFKIKDAKTNGWGEDYVFSIDKEGYVHIKLKKNKTLAEISNDLGLYEGSLDSTNNFESRYGRIPVAIIDGKIIETWDAYEAKKGESFKIESVDINTERTWTQAFIDTGKVIMQKTKELWHRFTN
jgi:hypothetical protein